MFFNNIYAYILNIGIDSSISDEEAKKVRIHNQLGFVSASLLSIFPILFVVFEMYEGIFLCLFGMIPVILPYILNYYQKFLLSKFITIITGYNTFLLGILLFGYNCGFNYGLFAVFVLPILYLPKTSHRLLMYLFLTLETILILVSLKNNIPLFYEPDQKILLNNILFIACAALVISFFISADSTNKFYEGKNVQLVKKLTQRNEELKHFSYSTSHDLRQPLNTILNFVNLFHKKKSAQLDEEGKIFLKYIGNASTKLDQLIEGLLQHSLLGQSNKTSTFDCQQLVQELTFELQEMVQQQNATIHVGKLPFLFGNREEIKGVFHNLITNALKFHRPNISPIVHINVKETKTHWLFNVTDNGIGIEVDLYQKIFQIFQKGHTNKTIAGEGIGLAHCKKVIELHSGRIWIESIINEGSIFYFSLKKVGVVD